MKGTRLGVSVFDVGYICHLADLAAKPGMEVFPVDIYQ